MTFANEADRMNEKQRLKELVERARDLFIHDVLTRLDNHDPLKVAETRIRAWIEDVDDPEHDHEQ